MTTISGIIVPKDVIRLIFQASDDPASLRECSKVCKVFREIALNENILMSLFPDVVMPKGMTIQQWFLQGIHDRSDLLKCAEYYLSLAAQDKPIFLRISTPLNAELWISTDGTATVSETRVWCNKDLLPVVRASFCQQSQNYRLNRGWLSVILRNVGDNFDRQKLLSGIHSTLNKVDLKSLRALRYNKLNATKPASDSRALPIGVAAALTIAAVVAFVYCFSRSNNE